MITELFKTRKSALACLGTFTILFIFIYSTEQNLCFALVRALISFPVFCLFEKNSYLVKDRHVFETRSTYIKKAIINLIVMASILAVCTKVIYSDDVIKWLGGTIAYIVIDVILIWRVSMKKDIFNS